MIFVWNAQTAETLHFMTLPRGSRGVSAVAFSPDGLLVAAADMTDDYKLHIFDLKDSPVKGKVPLLCTCKSDRKKIQQVLFVPAVPTQLLSVSTESFISWTLTRQAKPGNATLTKTVNKNPAPVPTPFGFSSLTISDKDSTAFLGASDGCIYRFKGGLGKGEKLHDKMVSAVQIRVDEKNTEILLTGSLDCTVKIHRIAGTGLQLLNTFSVDGAPRSLDMLAGKILVGTSYGTIQEINEKTKASEDLIRSHSDGEVWGLCMIDEVGTSRYLTSGDDNNLLLYDITLRKVVGKGTVSADPSSTKKFMGGASTMSKRPTHQQSRALAYNSELNHLAVGQNNGAVSIRVVEGLEMDDKKLIDLDRVFQTLTDSSEWIEFMAYSPKYTYLAVGSHDNSIYIYTVG